MLSDPKFQGWIWSWLWRMTRCSRYTSMIARWSCSFLPGRAPVQPPLVMPDEDEVQVNQHWFLYFLARRPYENIFAGNKIMTSSCPELVGWRRRMLSKFVEIILSGVKVPSLKHNYIFSCGSNSTNTAVCLSVCLSVCWSVCLSVCFPQMCSAWPKPILLSFTTSATPV